MPTEIHTDLSPFLRLYSDGSVHRLMGSPLIPPSPHLPDPSNSVLSTDTHTTTPTPTPTCRLFLPTPTPHHKLPILLYFHGGGFCVESAFSSLHHRYTNALSSAATALVVSVEYRLAPEHPLPAAYDDAWTALIWLCSHALPGANDGSQSHKHPWITNHGDLNRLFIGGDSAGGNIVHNVAMRAGSEPLPGSVEITGAIVSHPFFWGSNPVGNEPKENIEQSFCYRLWLFIYPNADKGVDCPLINPVEREAAAKLSGLGCKKLLVCVAEKDVLAGRALAYAEKVRESGWKGLVEVELVAGEEHCFQVDDPDSPKAKDLIKRIAEFISH